MKAMYLIKTGEVVAMYQDSDQVEVPARSKALEPLLAIAENVADPGPFFPKAYKYQDGKLSVCKWQLLQTAATEAELLAARQSQMQREIQERHDQEVTRPLDIGGGVVVRQADALARLVGAQQNGNANRKTIINGEPVMAAPADINTMVSAVMAHQDAVGENAFNLATAVKAAGDQDALDQVDITTGWN